MNPFNPAWRSGITIPPSKKRRYKYKGLVPIERQAAAITIIPRAKAIADSDKRDGMKRCISMKEQS